MKESEYSYTGDLTIETLNTLLAKNPIENHKIYLKLKVINDSKKQKFLDKMISRYLNKLITGQIDTRTVNKKKNLEFEYSSSKFEKSIFTTNKQIDIVNYKFEKQELVAMKSAISSCFML